MSPIDLHWILTESTFISKYTEDRETHCVKNEIQLNFKAERTDRAGLIWNVSALPSGYASENSDFVKCLTVYFSLSVYLLSDLSVIGNVLSS